MTAPRARHTRKRRVFLLDDHPLLRERLAEIIEATPDMLVCGQAEASAGLHPMLAGTQPDLLILDSAPPDCDGIELLKELHARYPKLKMLVLSDQDETLYGERAIRAGATGFLSKRSSSSTLANAIRRVCEGDLVLSDRLRDFLAAKCIRGNAARRARSVDNLTDRELQVFNLIGDGWPTKHIGRRLRLSLPTVGTYRSRIKEKLNLSNSTELLQSAIRWKQSSGYDRPRAR